MGGPIEFCGNPFLTNLYKQILSLKLAHRQLDCRRSSLPNQAASLEGWICNLSTFSEMGRLCWDLLRCEVKHEIKIDHMNLRQLSQTAHLLVRPEVAWNHLVKTDCEDLRGLKMEAMERKPSWNLHQLTSGYYVALRCTTLHYAIYFLTESHESQI